MIAQSQAASITETARSAAREDIKMDTLVAKYEAEHHFFDPEGDTYNQEAVDEVLFLRKSFEQQGLTRTQALTKAVTYVVKSMAPTVDAPPTKGLRENDTRQKDAITKKLAAARAQAPDMGDTGLDSDKVGGALDASAIMKMSQDAFAKLSEQELSKSRGDTL